MERQGRCDRHGVQEVRIICRDIDAVDSTMAAQTQVS